MARVVWLARHGNREDFVDPQWHLRAERRGDPGLSEDGHEQARRLAERLRGEGIARIYASPFLRTVQTAHAVAEAVEAPVHLDWGIGEWLYPKWLPEPPELLAPEALARQFRKIDLSHDPGEMPPHPESYRAMRARTEAAARRLAGDPADAILLVGHEASVLGSAAGLAGPIGAERCGLCGLFRLRRSARGAWQVELCADVTHLQEEVVSQK